MPPDTDDIRSKQEQRDAHLRRCAPGNEIPAGLPAQAVLGRTEDVAVGLVGARAYSNGVKFDISVRGRPSSARVRELYDLVEWSAGWPWGAGDGKGLLLGVEFSDGRTATNLDMPAQNSDVTPTDTPLLTPGEASGGGCRFDGTYWLTPVPPPGALVLVCAWPALDIPETRTTLDGALIDAASRSAVVLWPWEPEVDYAVPSPPDPDVPKGGWFARTLARG